MGLRQWIAEQVRTQPDRMSQPTFGAMANPLDSGGRPIVQFSPQVIEVLRLAGLTQSYGGIYRTQPSVRICVDFLAKNIGHLNLKTYTKNYETGEQMEQRRHPLALLLQRPNPRTVRFDFIRDTVSDLAIYDDAYWLKKFIGNQRQLYRIPPIFVSPKFGNILTGVDHYDIGVGNNTTSFKPEEVVHFSGYDPEDTRVGSSTLGALKMLLTEELNSSQHRASFWNNAARRDGIIERPVDVEWSDTDRERFRIDWQNAHSGNLNAGKTVILEDGMKWNPDSFSPKDSEYIPGRQWALDTVATAYGIPLAVLSRTNTATFASVKEFRKMLYVDTLGPWTAQIEAAVWGQLIPDFGDDTLWVEFNIAEKLQGDFEQQAEAARSSTQVPYQSVNDTRKVLGLPRIEDPLYDVPAKPANYLYGDQQPIQQPAAPRLAPAALSENGDKDIADLEWIMEETR